jgi:response regulator of citrate/malate metabolism
VTIRVLVVEDESRVARAHAAYVERVPGFEVAGTVHTAGDALRQLSRRRAADLLLLDLNLPDGHGLALLQRLRTGGQLCDVIAVTAARDPAMVRSAVAHGVVLYLLKPFTFATFRAKLEQYADYRRLLGVASTSVMQDEVDEFLAALRVQASPAALPKGLSEQRLRDVTDGLRGTRDGLSATELGEQIGISRVTARRYLEHLAGAGVAERTLRQGRSGRPEVEYVWRHVAPLTHPR